MTTTRAAPALLLAIDGREDLAPLVLDQAELLTLPRGEGALLPPTGPHAWFATGDLVRWLDGSDVTGAEVDSRIGAWLAQAAPDELVLAQPVGHLVQEALDTRYEPRELVAMLAMVAGDDLAVAYAGACGFDDFDEALHQGAGSLVLRGVCTVDGDELEVSSEHVAVVTAWIEARALLRLAGGGTGDEPVVRDVKIGEEFAVLVEQSAETTVLRLVDPEDAIGVLLLPALDPLDEVVPIAGEGPVGAPVRRWDLRGWVADQDVVEFGLTWIHDRADRWWIDPSDEGRPPELVDAPTLVEFVADRLAAATAHATHR